MGDDRASYRPPTQGPAPETYNATPGVVMGAIGFVFGGLFFHIPALVMGIRGKRVRNAGGSAPGAGWSYGLGLAGIIVAAVGTLLVVVLVASGMSAETSIDDIGQAVTTIA